MSERHAETEWQKAALKVRQLEAENARLREALKPFILFGDALDRPPREGFSANPLTADDFQRARAALTSAKEKM